MRGWRPALRLAWREARRARARSILVLIMIALPVLAVTAAAVVQATQAISGVDAIPRTMGAAEARIEPMGGTVLQAPDPMSGNYGTLESGELPTLADLAGVLGDREVIPIVDGYAEVPLGERRLEVNTTEVDLHDPLTRGLFELTSGVLPSKPGEVVINDAFAERGVGIGDTLDVLGQDVTVVGIGRDATYRDALKMIGPADSFGDVRGQESTPDWLVGGDPLLWSDVQAINKQGGLVYSRAVLNDPPPVVEIAEQMGYDTGYGDYIAIASLIIAMALLEVVLLAGPAFAVSARRQARTLALMAASGGTPSQARRVVLASGIVLGSLAALFGAVLGVILGVALLPLVQRFSNVWFGPIDVNWLAVALVAAFGLLSAFLAAVVPAWLASRQDVVAVLAGRRGDAPPSARTPILGLVLLCVGIALSVMGIKGNEYSIAVGAIVAVFGMIFIVPLVVAVVARLSGRFPLVMRYAARDAARHRTRTVPAVAAVAATVAGVVALGIANTSDEAQNRETYQPTLAMGAATIGVHPDYDMNTGVGTPPPDEVWGRIDDALAERLPDVRPELLRGQRSDLPGGDSVYLDVVQRDDSFMYGSWGGAPSNAVTLVSDGPVPGLIDVDSEERAEITAALKAGKAVVFAASQVDDDEVTIRKNIYSSSGDGKERHSKFTWPALFVQSSGMVPVQLLLPTVLAEETGAPITTIGFYLSDPDMSKDVQKDLKETLGGISENASLYVERGYQADSETFILMLILFTLGGVLMLGGTLTATFLALSDAWPDLATLAAVGAAPRTRRGVASSYALVVGFVGAVLGALVGFIPGVAITYPLTSQSDGSCAGSGSGPIVCESAGPFIDIPWLLIVGLVVALPLLTALIVGLTARSKLPLVARLT